MAGFIALIPAEYWRTKKIHIAYRIQQLVAHELVIKAQALFIHHPETIDNHGVIQTAAKGKPMTLQIFNIAQKAESTRARIIADIVLRSEIQTGMAVAVAKNEMIELD